MNLKYSDSRPGVLVIIERLVSLTFIFSLNTILSEMVRMKLGQTECPFKQDRK